LKGYLTGQDLPFLLEQASGVMINVIQIKGIVDTVDDTIYRESHGALQNPEVINAAVKAAVRSAGGGGE
jgi:hypothetical protein